MDKMTEKHFITLDDTNVEVENLTVEPVIEPTEDNIDEILKNPNPNIQFKGKITNKEKLNELKKAIDEYESNLHEQVIKGFYETFPDVFGDMPYPVARECIIKYFHFNNFEVKGNTLVFNPEWKLPEQVVDEDMDTPLLDKWLNKQYEKKRE